MKKYKSFNINSKFIKPNKFGQIAKDCIYFTVMKKHCWDVDKGNYDNAAAECVVLKNEFCKTYKRGAR